MNRIEKLNCLSLCSVSLSFTFRISEGVIFSPKVNFIEMHLTMINLNVLTSFILTASDEKDKEIFFYVFLFFSFFYCKLRTTTCEIGGLECLNFILTLGENETTFI